jgi:hypothetical protein
MSNDEISSINIRRILDWFLGNPDILCTYDDMKYLRELTSESRIREALRKLVSRKILSADNPTGRPRSKKEEQERRIRYGINRDLDTFQKLFYLYFEDGMEEFLGSNYTNHIIEQHQFSDIYEIIKDKLEISRFRRVASKALLNQPATIDEFKSIPKSTINYLDEWKDVPFYLSNLRFLDIETLRYLDPIEAVSFCRNNLCEIFLDMHKKIGGRKIRSSNEVLLQFNKLDCHLSPFTSYPVYEPIELLFSRPFNRLYEDVYLLDESDFELFIERAYLVFINFVDFIYIYLNNIHTPLDWETSVREFVFLWNITKYQIDRCEMHIKSLYSKKEDSGKYYLSSRGPLLEIMDLMDGKNLIEGHNYGELSRGEGPIPHFDEPFDYLIPCFAFRELGNDRPKSINDIIHFIKYKLNSEDRKRKRFNWDVSINRFSFFDPSDELSFRIY